MANQQLINAVGVLAVVLVVVGAINWLLLAITGKREVQRDGKVVLKGTNIVAPLGEAGSRIVYVIIALAAVALLAGGFWKLGTDANFKGKLPSKSGALATLVVLLLVVGSLVWGIEGVLGVNVVEALLGKSKGGRIVADAVYYAVGISAIIFLLAGGAKAASVTYNKKIGKM
jgi:uncharacterized membrane protein YuzA (DUF378 family)